MVDKPQAVRMLDYQQAVAGFSIENAAKCLSGDLAGGVNAYIECCERHCGSNRLALRAVSAGGELREYSFEDLRDLSGRIANILHKQGVGRGDVVAGLLPRIPELIATVLATWRLGGVYQPLFTAFGPKAIEQRLGTSQAKIVLTTPQYRSKLEGVADCPAVACFGASGIAGDLDMSVAVETAESAFTPVLCDGNDMFMMLSTSGTTGLPKGVPVPLRAMVAFDAYMRQAVDLRPDDVFWNVADPGWAYGLYYGVTGPFLLGAATTFYEGGFTADTTYDLIKRFGVTNLAGSPSAFRVLMAAGPEAANRIKGQLRAVSSAGEPLNPEVIRWFEAELGTVVHDHYGQTELGMVVNNHHALAHDVHPGSAGFAMPGYRVAVLDDDGNELGPNQPGVLSVDIGKSPLLWFTGYYRKDTPAIEGGYYRTGDTVELEPNGAISFIGREDDVITSSGYRIGPFDVESALLEHPAVNEAAVVGVPDPTRTELVKAFVVLAPGYEGSDALTEELALHVRNRLSAHAYPRAISYMEELPKTPSGKIQRFLLRKAEIDKQQAEKQDA